MKWIGISRRERRTLVAPEHGLLGWPAFALGGRTTTARARSLRVKCTGIVRSADNTQLICLHAPPSRPTLRRLKNTCSHPKFIQTGLKLSMHVLRTDRSSLRRSSTVCSVSQARGDGDDDDGRRRRQDKRSHQPRTSVITNRSSVLPARQDVDCRTFHAGRRRSAAGRCAV